MEKRFTESDSLVVQRLSHELIGDFYQTFRLTQGVPDIQPPLFRLLAVEYEIAGYNNLLTDALEMAGTSVDKLKLPSRHKAISEQQRMIDRFGFRPMWAQFSEALVGQKTINYQSPDLLGLDIMKGDIYYQVFSRPNRQPPSDEHESIFREYILGDNLHGSAQLKGVSARLRDAFYEPSEENVETVLVGFAKLSTLWEGNHPGQTFLPE